MFGIAILEVVIGLLFVFTFAALIASMIQEIIATRLRWRADDLKEHLCTLLRRSDKCDLQAELYKHPLVQGLFTKDKPPSYIAAATFATALLDVVAPSTEAAGPRDANGLRAAITGNAALSDEVKRAMLALIDQAGGNADLAAVRLRIEAWFNDSMERLTGLYKRRAQLALFLLGLGMAVILNIDTVRIGRALLVNPELRQSIVAAAEAAERERSRSGTQPATSPVTPEELAKVYDRFAALRLPIGWNKQYGDEFLPGNRVKAGEWLGSLLGPVLGWLITALAVTLGAPFWFDALNKVMLLRTAVKPGAKKT